MTRDEYAADICRRWLAEAKQVPFRKVSPKEWVPKEGDCHGNVDRWVADNRDWTAVRGWVNTPRYMTLALTHHSIVKDVEGRLFDITPFADERYRPTTRFIWHIGDERTFCEMKAIGTFVYCEQRGAK
jgi:hypothetical protein